MTQQGRLWLAVGAGVLGMVLLRHLFADDSAYASDDDDVDSDYREAIGAKYPPGSAKQVALFEKAADIAGVPREWAKSPSLHKILGQESGGRVGIPNFLWASWLGMSAKQMRETPSEWPKVWKMIREGKAKPSQTGISSHAAGLGQLQPSNMKAYQPSGIQGIGIPIEEAVGMLLYVKDRYGTPDKAWEFWQSHSQY